MAHFSCSIVVGRREVREAPCRGLLCFLTLWLLVANSIDTKYREKAVNRETQPYLLVLRKSYLMNTNMPGFSKMFAFVCLAQN